MLVEIREQMLSGGGGEESAGVYRFSGTVRLDSQLQPWSVIAKLVHGKQTTRPNRAASSEREIRLYASGALTGLPSPVRAPRIYALTEFSGDISCLWLEDLSGVTIDAWTLDDFDLAATNLGVFNGQYFGQTAVLGKLTWSGGWLEQYLTQADGTFRQLPQLMSFPLVRKTFPGRDLARLQSVWERRHALLKRLETTSTVFCHLDANCRNVFFEKSLEGHKTLCLIDWAMSGPAPLGAELSSLVFGSVLLYGAEPSLLPELRERVLAAYLSGLRQAGCDEPEPTVKDCFAVFSLLRYAAYHLVRLKVLCDEKSIAWAERVIGHSIESFIDRLVHIQDFLYRTLPKDC